MWTPDGREIVIADAGRDDAALVAVDVETSASRLFTPVPPFEGLFVPDWSPDGRWLVFSGTTDATNLGIVMPADGDAYYVVASRAADATWRPA